MAHGLNILFGVDLSTAVFLAATDAVIFPLFDGLLVRLLFVFLLSYPVIVFDKLIPAVFSGKLQDEFPMDVHGRYHLAFIFSWSVDQSIGKSSFFERD